MSGLNPKSRPSPRGTATPQPPASNKGLSSVGPPIRATRTPLSGRKQQDNTSSIPKRKVKITAEQQHYIMEQIENGNYSKEAGIEQWANLIGVKSKPKCHQNLLSSFANSNPPFGETITGVNLNRQLFNGRENQDNLLNPSICSTIMGDGAFAAEINSLLEFEEFGDENGLTEYRTKMYELLKIMDKKFRSCLEAQKIKSEKNLTKIFPIQSLENLQKKLSQVTSSLEKFIDRSTSENSKLFLQSNSTTRGIPCPVEEHKDFLRGINSISEAMIVIDEFHKVDFTDANCEKILKNFQAELEKFESELNAEEKANFEMKQLQMQLKRLSLPSESEKEFDTSNSNNISG